MKNFHQSGKTFKTNGRVHKKGNALFLLKDKHITKKVEIPNQVKTTENKVVKPVLKNAIFVSGEVLIIAPDSPYEFIKKGNTVFIALDTITWLESVSGRSDIGLDALDAINNIARLQEENNKSLVIYDFDDDFLKKQPQSHVDGITLKIINQAIKKANEPNNGFDKVKFVSRRQGFRISAKHLSNKSAKPIVVDDYYKDKVLTNLENIIPKINIDNKHLTTKGKKIALDLIADNTCKINDGIILVGTETGTTSKPQTCAVIRKEDYYKIVPGDVSILGIHPYSKDQSEFNWSQAIAIDQLLDPSIHLSIITGLVGSGKTLLAVASGLYQVINKKYKKLIISRPIAPFGDGSDDLGYMPGNKEEKLADWLRPIDDAFEFIIESSKDKNMRDIIDNLKGKGKIIVESLNTIRGRTFPEACFVVIETQNGTPHQIECIIERAGEGCKVILDGDPNQVDKGLLGKRSNGLVVAINKMRPHPIVSVVSLQSNERSKLSKLAYERYNLT